MNKILKRPISFRMGVPGQPADEIISMIRLSPRYQPPCCMVVWDKSQFDIPDAIFTALDAISRLDRNLDNLAVLPLADDCFKAAKWFQDKGMELANKEFKRRADEP